MAAASLKTRLLTHYYLRTKSFSTISASGQHTAQSNGKGWERTGKPLKLFVAATLEKAITYAFAESPIRNAEARGSNPRCSTITLLFSGIYKIARMG